MVSGRSSESVGSSRTVVRIKTTAAIKLDETNFFSWKAQTLANFRGYELLRFVDSPVDTLQSIRSPARPVPPRLAFLSTTSFNPISSCCIHVFTRRMVCFARHFQRKIKKPEASTQALIIKFQERGLNNGSAPGRYLKESWWSKGRGHRRGRRGTRSVCIRQSWLVVWRLCYSSNDHFRGTCHSPNSRDSLKLTKRGVSEKHLLHFRRQIMPISHLNQETWYHPLRTLIDLRYSAKSAIREVILLSSIITDTTNIATRLLLSGSSWSS